VKVDFLKIEKDSRMLLGKEMDSELLFGKDMDWTIHDDFPLLITCVKTECCKVKVKSQQLRSQSINYSKQRFSHGLRQILK